MFLFLFFLANYKRSIGDNVGEQIQQQPVVVQQQELPQQQYKYTTQPFAYDTNNKNVAPASTTTTANVAPLYATTKTNGFAVNSNNAFATGYPPQQQQIDKVTGQPVPAPRRTNSIPLGDSVGGGVNDDISHTAVPQNGSGSSSSKSAPTSATDSSEAQV